MAKFRVLESKIFPGEWLWVLEDTDGTDVVKNDHNFKSEKEALEHIKKLKRVFRSRCIKVEVEK